MADLRRSVRDLFLQGVEAVNNAANHVANATRSKVDELNLRNRRKELLDTLASALYEQWQQGLELPETMTGMLEQIRSIDEQLKDLESQQEKPQAEEAAAESEAAPSIVVEEEADAPEQETAGAEAEVPTIQVEESVGESEE